MWVRAPPPADQKPPKVLYISAKSGVFTVYSSAGSHSRDLALNSIQYQFNYVYMASASAISSLYIGRLLNVAK